MKEVNENRKPSCGLPEKIENHTARCINIFQTYAPKRNHSKYSVPLDRIVGENHHDDNQSTYSTQNRFDGDPYLLHSKYRKCTNRTNCAQDQHRWKYKRPEIHPATSRFDRPCQSSSLDQQWCESLGNLFIGLSYSESSTQCLLHGSDVRSIERIRRR